jgi:hypothetical protein
MTLDLEEGPVQQQQVSFESEQQEEEDAVRALICCLLAVSPSDLRPLSGGQAH